MINQLNEIDSSKELDALENHLFSQINQMEIPCNTNQMLKQLKNNQMLILTTLMNEMRFTRDLVNQMAVALDE